MRSEFIRTLIDIAEKDKRVVLLTADLGYSILEQFAEKFPDRFFNVGVAEQNMIGLSTGLAEAGFIPFTYSISTFAVLRPYEFIRNGPVLHQLPVRVIGVGGGLTYGTNGITHFGLEDIGVLRIQPDMHVIVPADKKQAKNALLETWNLAGPIYYRLGKEDRADASINFDGQFKFGQVQTIGDGKDLLFISMGPILNNVYQASQQLSEQGISTSIAVVSDCGSVDSLASLIDNFTLAITVEDHYVTGGLGSMVSEIIAERNLKCRLIRQGVSEMPRDIVGSQVFIEKHFGLLPEQLAGLAIKNIGDSK